MEFEENYYVTWGIGTRNIPVISWVNFPSILHDEKTTNADFLKAI